MHVKVPGGLSDIIATPPSLLKDFDWRRFLVTGKKPVSHLSSRTARRIHVTRGHTALLSQNSPWEDNEAICLGRIVSFLSTGKMRRCLRRAWIDQQKTV